MLARHRIQYSLLFALATSFTSVSFGQQSNITQLGFIDAEHTRDDGYQVSYYGGSNSSGLIVGFSDRFDGGSTNGRSAWLYDGTTTTRIGLEDGEHTSVEGVRNNIAVRASESGTVLGLANRYNGTPNFRGQSVWLYNGSETLNIGLTGAEFTRSDGYRYSSFSRMNAAGVVFGSSDQFLSTGNVPSGNSIWYFDGTSTAEIGLLDTAHQNANGSRQVDVFNDLNQGGYVRGHSLRYDSNGDWVGVSAWVYNGTTTTRLGFFDATYTGSDNWQESRTRAMSDTGFVVGISNRFQGNALLERTTWLYNGSTTTVIGLTDNEHTKSGGYNSGDVDDVNNSGHAVGYTERYNGGTVYLGQSAWYFDGSGAQQIGLYTTEYTKADGSIVNSNFAMNNSGQAAGYADRWNGGSALWLGRSAWYFDGSQSANIALTDQEHTRNDGFQHTTLHGITEQGTVVGTSNRYNGLSSDMGSSAWYYDGTQTIEIGLEGVEFVRNDGYSFDRFLSINSQGDVAGQTTRFIGSTNAGESAWLFDAELGQTFELTLSERSDGYAYSFARFLSEDGSVLGEYTLFDENDVELGERAFYFSTELGLVDLGQLVDGGLAAAGWESLGRGIQKNGLGQLIGHGALLGTPTESQAVFVVTPMAVPEPGSASLVAIAMLTLLGWRRRSCHST